jgi:hypothetical protein
MQNVKLFSAGIDVNAFFAHAQANLKQPENA